MKAGAAAHQVCKLNSPQSIWIAREDGTGRAAGIENALAETAKKSDRPSDRWRRLPFGNTIAWVRPGGFHVALYVGAPAIDPSIDQLSPGIEQPAYFHRVIAVEVAEKEDTGSQGSLFPVTREIAGAHQ